MSTQDTKLPPLPDFSAYEKAFAAELEFHCLAYARAAIAAQAPQAQGVPRLNYVPLHEFAELHRVDYNKLCKAVLESVLAAAPQAEPTQAQDTLSVVRRFERMVGDYNCLFTEYQGKAMPADVYQRFTALREERIPTARKELAALLAAAPQATHEANTHPEGAEQDELVERVMRSAQTLVLAVHFKRPKADQDALRNNLRMEMRAALAAPQAEPQPEREPIPAMTWDQFKAASRVEFSEYGDDDTMDTATADEIETAMRIVRLVERHHDIGTKGGTAA